MAEELGLSERLARYILKDRVEDGWLQVTNPRVVPEPTVYRQISAIHRQLIGNASGIENDVSVITPKTP